MVSALAFHGPLFISIQPTVAQWPFEPCKGYVCLHTWSFQIDVCLQRGRWTAERIILTGWCELVLHPELLREWPRIVDVCFHRPENAS